MKNYHKSVLLNETVNNLIMNKSGIYIDGTIGFAGHAKHILSQLDNNIYSSITVYKIPTQPSNIRVWTL